MSKIPEIKIEETKALDKRLESAQSELDANPKLFMEVSLYGEALRLRAELLPKPERIVKDTEGNDVVIPAQKGIDVLTCTLDRLCDELEDARISGYEVRTQFLLRVLAVRFKDQFDTSMVNITNNDRTSWIMMRDRAKNDLEFLGECGFGITPEGIKPTLKRIL